MRGSLALALLTVSFVAAGAARAAEVETLRQAGPPDKRFNLVVLGDGYRTQDQAQLSTDAKAIVDYLFNVAPLKQYAQFFNVKLVHVISNENGADNGTFGAQRDTALGAYFNCENLPRLLCVDQVAATNTAAANVKEVNFTLVLVNDPKYGGSGGSLCVASTDALSFEIVAHELGHGIAKLADEYSAAGSKDACDSVQDCDEANVTLRSQRDQIKWKDWIDNATPIPTPDADPYGTSIGLFEGARYLDKGVYRPRHDCKMRTLGTDYCPVCAEQFVRSIWTADNIQMIESVSPVEASVQSDTCDAVRLSVTNPPITPSTYKYVWTVDGNVQLEITNQLMLTPGVVAAGQHHVKVAVADATSLVRTDPNGLLKDEHSWSVALSKSDCPVSMGGGPGVGGTGGAGAGGVGPAGVAGVATGGAGGALAKAGDGGVPASGFAGMGGGGVPAALTPAPPPQDASGCSCAVPSREVPRHTCALSVLALVSLGRRRRRR